MNDRFDKYTVLKPRTIEQVVMGRPTSDGAGVKLTRILTHHLQKRLDPFLLIDTFFSNNPNDYIGGFPDHPHRGFETITYMIAGHVKHRDSAGHEGLLGSGGLQWMVAGRGVIHSEMPQQENGLMEGFQIWLNLPAKEKMCKPFYQDFKAEALPCFVTDQQVKVIVIAGKSHGTVGAVQRDTTLPTYLDIHLPQGTFFEQTLPDDHSVAVYVYRGHVEINQQTITAQHLAIFNNDLQSDGVIIQAREDAKVLLIAGKPLHEPIAQYGPFVMNTQDEIAQAIRDYEAGRLAC